MNIFDEIDNSVKEVYEEEMPKKNTNRAKRRQTDISHAVKKYKLSKSLNSFDNTAWFDWKLARRGKSGLHIYSKNKVHTCDSYRWMRKFRQPYGHELAKIQAMDKDIRKYESFGCHEALLEDLV